MRWIDGHLDLAYLAVNGRDMLRDQPPAGACVTLGALRQADVEVAFGTIFTEPTPGEPESSKPYCYRADDIDGAEAAGLRQLEIYERWEAAGAIAIVRSVADLDCSTPLPKIVLLMEGADPIRSPEHVQQWFARGLRIVGLTWASGTRYAGGNGSHPGSGPLTPLGVEMIHALDAAGIVHDVSHLSDAAFDGVMEHARGRVIASHSNCRALVEDKQRHLRDDQIKAIAQRNGIIGLNLYAAFLVPRAVRKQPGGRRATIADCIAHLQHVTELMGHRRGVAMGSDMDGGFGIDDLPVGLDHPAKFDLLADALCDAGWSDEDVRGFAHENWRGFLRQSLRA